MEIEKGSHYTMRIPDQKFWFTAISREIPGYSWSNCMYLNFAKEDFPQIESPPLVDSDMFKGRPKRFEYHESVLEGLEFHGGITFYEETFVLESQKTYVKVGCDYQHLYDDGYRTADFGREILRDDAPAIAERFKKLVSK